MEWVWFLELLDNDVSIYLDNTVSWFWCIGIVNKLNMQIWPWIIGNMYFYGIQHGYVILCPK